MKRLVACEIRNYRSIGHARLEFGPCTVLVGASDSGKSNVLRAIRDCIWNATAGPDMIALGEQEAAVALTFEASSGDQVVVTWRRACQAGKNTTEYWLDRAGTRTVFKSPGRACPPQIAAILRAGPVEIEPGDAVRPNMQDQAEPWFLLPPTWGPARIARALGTVTGLEAYLLAARDLRGEVQRFEADIRQREERVRQREAVAQAGPDLARLEQALERARQAQAALAACRATLQRAMQGLQAVLAIRASQDPARLQRAEALLGKAYVDLAGLESLRARVDQADQAIRAQTHQINLRNSAELLERGIQAELDQVRQRALADLEDQKTCPVCQGPAHEGCLARAREGLA